MSDKTAAPAPPRDPDGLGGWYWDPDERMSVDELRATQTRVCGRSSSTRAPTSPSMASGWPTPASSRATSIARAP